MNIAIGTHAHWNKVKKYYPDYQFYHEQGGLPSVADKILFVTSSGANIPLIECTSAEYIPEREYRKDCPMAIKIDGSKPRLTKLEFHLADHCNLNCDSCNHFCNLDTTPRFPNFENVRKDLMRIKELFWGIGTLYLVGGEPFLNKELGEYCDMVRELFPDSDISVITNGILLAKSCDNEIMRALERNEIKLLITRYPVTENLLDKIKENLRGVHANVEYTPYVKTFTKKLGEKCGDKVKAYKNCHEKECHYLENGKIYGCTLFGRIKVLNEKFGTNYPDVGLDIYKYKDGWTLNEKLENQFPYCSYCSPLYENVLWKHGGECTLDNWIVKNPQKRTIKDKILDVKGKIERRLG